MFGSKGEIRQTDADIPGIDEHVAVACGGHAQEQAVEIGNQEGVRAIGRDAVTSEGT